MKPEVKFDGRVLFQKWKMYTWESNGLRKGQVHFVAVQGPVRREEFKEGDRQPRTPYEVRTQAWGFWKRQEEIKRKREERERRIRENQITLF